MSCRLIADRPLLKLVRPVTVHPIALVLAVGIVAAFLRLLDLGETPPGFAELEARVALASRSIGDDGLPLLPSGGIAPAFLWLMQPFGVLLDWDVIAPRATAALLGIIAVVACALWFRRTLGVGWGLVGGLLAAAWFPLLLHSRVGLPEIGAGAAAATGFWLLWEARDGAGNRRGWALTSGVAFGIGAWFSVAGFLLLPVALIVIIVALVAEPMDEDGPARDSRPIALAIIGLLVVAAPLIAQVVVEPDALRARIERDWDGDGRVEEIRDPAGIVSGIGQTLASLVIDGYDAPLVNLPGRPLLDPILALLSLLGLAALLRSPTHPLHAASLIWLVASLILPALVAPGHPGLLLPATPALLLLPLLGVRAAIALTRNRQPVVTRVVTTVAVMGIMLSAAWSLWDYWDNWSDSREVYAAFDGDIRASLDAASELPRDAGPVYLATWGHEEQIRYLAPDQIHEVIDGRTHLALPASGIGYLVVPGSTPLASELRAIVEQGALLERRDGPRGAVAAEVWRLGPETRDALPATVPTIRFPGEISLVGFDVRPDLGDAATTGRLPDPPRVVVTLVWSVPRGGAERIAQIRLVPADPIFADDARTASVPLDPGERPVGAGERELIVTRASIVVPRTPDQIIDVQAGLLTTGLALLPPVSPPSAISGGYALLNRVQYIDP